MTTDIPINAFNLDEVDTSNYVSIEIVLGEHHPTGEPPKYETDGAAGADLMSAHHSDIILGAGEHFLFPTGVSVAIPNNFEIQVRPRSGLAVNKCITVQNSPGTVDSDYRGEIRVGLINLGDKPQMISRGMRIAQMVVAPVYKAKWEIKTELSTTKRGSGGFGSTGE